MTKRPATNAVHKVNQKPTVSGDVCPSYRQSDAAGHVRHFSSESAPSAPEYLPLLHFVQAAADVAPTMAEKVPASQGVHAEEPEPVWVPARQAVHDVALDWRLYDPALHGEHSGEPDWAANEPAEHSKHTVADTGENVPGSQTAQVVDFDCRENVPCSHGEQSGEPCTGAYVPASHTLHDDEPSDENQPGGHWMQVDSSTAPMLAEYFPLAHLVHDAVPA
mmetsp:Transcript_868/g.1903  ORF Transcript_868/g.1903 Transcript_868/m.1903 type:complete len:220 (-) Transcript_868:508-1167(-)|eukprot:CAMPEP_0114117894 /NCGR_PEP_ID=MMETSP0043_2-20121206/5286_1 /TAXON_ID=464988 /ORGANISM="Hemiselmis andersenii, Strain CCMP644" /LENGTH=219 /DNA_ID=CAMNT_0001210335 /DNA_START=238 /DNA_END=897 /DNA_ORIENTATION=-